MKSLGQMKKDLLKQKTEYIEIYQKLENELKNNEINQAEFDKKKNKIERKLVEIMDRLTQINFLS